MRPVRGTRKHVPGREVRANSTISGQRLISLQDISRSLTPPLVQALIRKKVVSPGPGPDLPLLLVPDDVLVTGDDDPFRLFSERR